MILKTVVTEDGFQKLVNFLASSQNEFRPGMFPEMPEILRLLVPEKPSSDGSTCLERIVDAGESVKLARIVNCPKFQYGSSNSVRFGYEVILEIGQKLVHTKKAKDKDFGDRTPPAQPLDVHMGLVMGILQPLFEILCQFSVEEKKA